MADVMVFVIAAVPVAKSSVETLVNIGDEVNVVV